MKPIIFVCTILFILTLTACSSQSKIDINRYLDEIYFSDSSDLSIDDFLLTSKGDEYVYKAVKNGALLSVFCNSKGEITQIVITTQKRSEFYDRLCIASIKAFAGSSQAENEYKKAVATGEAYTGDFKVTFSDYQIGQTIIINQKSDEINTNNNPTLKRYINEKDISRPTLSQ